MLTDVSDKKITANGAAIDGASNTSASNKCVAGASAANTQKSQQVAPDARAEARAVDGEAAAPDETTYSVSSGLLARLAGLNISIAITSYQSGLLYFIGRNADGGINVHQTALLKPMGLCTEKPADGSAPGGLTLTAAYQIMRFENVLQPGQVVNNAFDACYVPRTVHVTGALDAHDAGLDDKGRVVFVNTRFNCLSTPSARHSFEELWRPEFITDLVDEDRCHLNGLAMKDGKAAYVSAVSRSNTIDGWRDRRADGGIVIDVQSGQIVCDGLSMPHSPRLHNGRLWLLNSGTGELGTVEFDAPYKTPGTRDGKPAGAPETTIKGRFQPVAFCPGFLRGLAFSGNFAFVGLSKPRYERFEGLMLDQKLKDADSQAWCGVQIIDLNSGACVDWFRIDGKIGELYDVEIIPNVVCAMAVPPMSDEAAGLITYENMPVAIAPPLLQEAPPDCGKNEEGAAK